MTASKPSTTSKLSSVAAPRRPRGMQALVALGLCAVVMGWFGLRSFSTPRADTRQLETATQAIEEAPEPEPIVAEPPSAQAKPPVPARAAAPVAAPRPAPTPAKPPGYHFDPATDPPTVHGPEGLDIERTWANPRELSPEFGKHGKEFSTRSVYKYAAMAAHFFQEAPKYGFATKVDADGVIRIYDMGSNTYGEYNADGTTRKFFRPEEGGKYFDQQPGAPPLAP